MVIMRNGDQARLDRGVRTWGVPIQDKTSRAATACVRITLNRLRCTAYADPAMRGTYKGPTSKWQSFVIYVYMYLYIFFFCFFSFFGGGGWLSCALTAGHFACSN